MSGADTRGADTFDRPLSPEEVAGRMRHEPYLMLWSRYIESGEVDTVEQVQSSGMPLLVRPQHVVGRDSIHGEPLIPVVVSPRAALSVWREMAGQTIDAGPTLLERMIYAINWMGVAYGSVKPEVRSFFPKRDTWRTRPLRRRGYWYLSGEVVARLLNRHYVPVLTGGRGPRPAALVDKSYVASVTALALDTPKGRPRRSMTDVDATVRLIRDYAQAATPSCLLRRAYEEDVRLHRRGAGNPRWNGTDTLLVDRRGFCVSAARLALYADRAAGRLDLPRTGWSSAVMTALLGRVAEAYSGQVRRLDRFGTMDSPRGAQYPNDWYWVSHTLAQVELSEVDRSGLVAEFVEYRTLRDAEQMHMDHRLGVTRPDLAPHDPDDVDYWLDQNS